MTPEEALKSITDALSESAAQAALKALSEAYTDYLPHVEFDTQQNVELRAADAVEAILQGRFERKGEYICPAGLQVSIKLSTHEYDSMRKSMLEVMPECPKDLEIQSLKDQLARAYEDRS